MKKDEIPQVLLEAYIIGCLNRVVKDEPTTQPTCLPAEKAFLRGIRDGLALEIGFDEEKLSIVELIAIEGLRLQDPELGLAAYPEPRNISDEGRRKYLWEYVRGLVDSTTIIAHESTELYAGRAMAFLNI